MAVLSTEPDIRQVESGLQLKSYTSSRWPRRVRTAVHCSFTPASLSLWPNSGASVSSFCRQMMMADSGKRHHIENTKTRPLVSHWFSSAKAVHEVLTSDMNLWTCRKSPTTGVECPLPQSKSCRCKPYRTSEFNLFLQILSRLTHNSPKYLEWNLA